MVSEAIEKWHVWVEVGDTLGLIGSMKEKEVLHIFKEVKKEGRKIKKKRKKERKKGKKKMELIFIKNIEKNGMTKWSQEKNAGMKK